MPKSAPINLRDSAASIITVMQRFILYSITTFASATGMVIFPHTATAAPSIFWASDPVGPDETVLLTGSELDGINAVVVTRLRDSAQDVSMKSTIGVTVEPLQRNSQSLKFVIPKSFEPGVYHFDLIGKDGNVSGYLNQPTVYWRQGDRGNSSSPGGWIRIFGRNIGRSASTTLVLSQAGRSSEPISLVADKWSLWDASFVLPGNIALGEYRLAISNGQGGRSSWQDVGTISIRVAQTPPLNVLDAKFFGAKGDGREDDTAAIRAALSALQSAGGGTLFFPRGRYLVSQHLSIPPNVTVKGQARDMVSLNWPEFKDPPPALIDGFSDFSIKNLTLYASNYASVISGGFPQNGQAIAGRRPANISIDNVLIRASAYRGHISQEETLSRYTKGRQHRSSLNGPVTIRLTGQNLRVVNCDIYGSGSAFFLFRPHGAYVAQNKFYNGRLGWYSITGADGVIFEHNSIAGADLQSTGGGINTLSGNVSSSQNIFFAQNSFSLMHGLDREAITSDGPGGYYYGHVHTLAPDKLLLADTTLGDLGGEPWKGAGILVVGGHGAGELAIIRAFDGNKTVTLDSNLPVALDETSIVTIVPIQRNYIFAKNTFSDSGVAIQFYGTSIDHVVAGNQSTRAGGFFTYGRYYHHFQPSWHIQLLDNKVMAGNIYRAGTNNATGDGSSKIGAFGVQTKPNGPPLTRGIVIRGNQLVQNAEIEVNGSNIASHAGIKDVIIESNYISDADIGIQIDAGSQDVVVRNNEFRNISRESIDDRSSLSR